MLLRDAPVDVLDTGGAPDVASELDGWRRTARDFVYEDVLGKTIGARGRGRGEDEPVGEEEGRARKFASAVLGRRWCA